MEGEGEDGLVMVDEDDLGGRDGSRSAGGLGDLDLSLEITVSRRPDGSLWGVDVWDGLVKCTR